jgi:twitching motility protein PilU
MEQGTNEGCQTFDESLFRLVREGKIDVEQALDNADSANNLRMRLRNGETGEESVAANTGPAFRIKGMRSTMALGGLKR